MPFIPLPGVLRDRALAKLLPQNGLLAALPDDVRARLLPHLGMVDLPAGQQIGQPGSTFARAYFPVAGVVSLIECTAGGGERIGGLVGSEGAVGLPKFMSDAAPTRVVVQSAGYGLALGRDQLLEEWARGGSFMRVLMRYSRALAAQKVVLASCHGHHSLEQQLCSILLMSLDRLPGQEMVLGQEAAARLLNVPAQQVADAVETLREHGIAAWRRPGLFAVHDRKALRALACACESRVTSEYQRLLPAADAAAAAAAPVADAVSRRAPRETSFARGGEDHPRS